MSNLQLPQITDYASAKGELDGTRYKVIAYKTALQDHGGIISVVHHNTDIIDYYPDGDINLNTGGWDTTTTSSRMHRLTPRSVRVFIKGGITYVETPLRKAEPIGYGVLLTAEEVAADWCDHSSDAAKHWDVCPVCFKPRKEVTA